VVSKYEDGEKMSGKLHSLTDVIKKTLFFFESLTAAELTPYVHKQMLFFS